MNSHEKLEGYFESNCANQTECVIDLFFLKGIVSDSCKGRILQDDPITSDQFIFMAGCLGDFVKLGESSKIDKDKLLICAVVFDGLSLFIMIFFFRRLEMINSEFLETFDNYQIDMKDFSIQCNDVLMDQATQASRLVKMKVWLYFTEKIKKV